MRVGSIRSRSTFRSSSGKCSLRTTALACKSWRIALSSSAGGTPPSASHSPGASLAKTWNDASLSPYFNQTCPLLPQQPKTGPGISGTEYLAKQEDRLTDAIADGLIEREAAQRKSAQIKSQRLAIYAEIEGLGNAQEARARALQYVQM